MSLVPERHMGTQCGAMVEKGMLAYRCTLPLGHGDSGEPHYAVEVDASVRAWQAWAESKPTATFDVTTSNTSEPFEHEHAWAQRGDSAVAYCVRPGCKVEAVVMGLHSIPVTQDDSLEPGTFIVGSKGLRPLLWCTEHEVTVDRCADLPHDPQPRWELDSHARAEITVNREPGPLERAMLMREAESSTRLDGETHVIDGPVTVGEPTKQRPGDQKLPQGGGDCVQDRIIAEMEESKRVGMERYGSILRTFNGRKGVQDFADEARDLHAYATMLTMEAEATREEMVEVVAKTLAQNLPGGSQLAATALADAAVDSILGAVVVRVQRQVDEALAETDAFQAGYEKARSLWDEGQ